MIRILLVDDQAIVREGLRAMLGVEPDLAVIGEAADGQEAIARVRELRPDIVLMDVHMPGMDGLAALRPLKAVAPNTSVIMVTLYDDLEYLVEAVAAGAAGYILKDASRDELVRAVRVTHSGGAIIAPSMLPDLLTRMAGLMQAPDPQEHSELRDVLSPRETEVLRLVAKGMTNQQIADQLIVSSTTVKTHVQNILQKLNVSDRTQAAVRALRIGIIS